MPISGTLFLVLPANFFILPAVFLLLAGFSIAHAACETDHFDLSTKVTYIFDGDTIEIESGERVRLVGVNTPELGRDGRKPEAFAQKAKKQLTQLIRQHDNRVKLRYGTQRRDKYNRLLAHVYLSNGASVSEWLLERGLATALTVPPNTWLHSCYQSAENSAKSANRGLWSLPEYQPIESTALKPGDTGFHLIRGKVIRVGHSKKSIWLNLAGNTALRIDRKDLRYFQNLKPESLLDKTLIARGWLYSYNEEMRLRIRHPAAIEIIQ